MTQLELCITECFISWFSMDLVVVSNGLFTLHGTGTGTGNETGTIVDNGSGFCPSLGLVTLFLYNILGPINPGTIACTCPGPV